MPGGLPSTLCITKQSRPIPQASLFLSLAFFIFFYFCFFRAPSPWSYIFMRYGQRFSLHGARAWYLFSCNAPPELLCVSRTSQEGVETELSTTLELDDRIRRFSSQWLMSYLLYRGMGVFYARLNSQKMEESEKLIWWLIWGVTLSGSFMPRGLVARVKYDTSFSPYTGKLKLNDCKKFIIFVSMPFFMISGI